MSRSFNGTTDRVDWASAGNLTGAAFTISAWIWPSSTPTAANEYVLCAHDSGDSQYGLVFNLLASGLQVDAIRHGAADYLWYSDANVLTRDAWNHVIITSNGGLLTGSLVIYVGGATIAQSFTNGSGAETAHTGKWSLGGRIYSDTRNLEGNLAEIAVWSRVLSGAEIAALASGIAPAVYPTGLLFCYSGEADTLVAEAGGTGTADGSAYATAHPKLMLAAADAAHALSSDAIALTQQHTLAVADAAHALSSDAIALTQAHTLAVADATHALSSDAIALTQPRNTNGFDYFNAGEPVPALSGKVDTSGFDYFSLVEPYVFITSGVWGGPAALTVADGTHALNSDAIALTQAHALTADDVAHALSSDAIALTQAHALQVADATHALSNDVVSLTQVHTLSVADAAHALSSDAISLTQRSALIVADATHALSNDAIALVQLHRLAVGDATHALSNDAISLTQLHRLAVADATHVLSNENIFFVWRGYVTLSETWPGVTLSDAPAVGVTIGEAVGTVVAGDSI